MDLDRRPSLMVPVWARDYEPGGRRFESCRAHQEFQIHSRNRELGLPSQSVTAHRRPNFRVADRVAGRFAWHSAWQKNGVPSFVYCELASLARDG
jgi:hypothetical protein